VSGHLCLKYFGKHTFVSKSAAPLSTLVGLSVVLPSYHFAIFIPSHDVAAELLASRFPFRALLTSYFMRPAVWPHHKLECLPNRTVC
jgi:hypothetical protein